MKDLKQQLAEHWPPMFAGTSLDSLSGGAIRWRTIQNQRAQKKIPKECFKRQGSRKVLVVRDQFLDWWMDQID